MKWKRNIYDADDAARSKRLKFTPEERAENAKKKAEVLGGKLEQAKQDLPKQRRPALKRTALVFRGHEFSESPHVSMPLVDSLSSAVA